MQKDNRKVKEEGREKIVVLIIKIELEIQILTKRVKEEDREVVEITGENQNIDKDYSLKNNLIKKMMTKMKFNSNKSITFLNKRRKCKKVKMT